MKKAVIRTGSKQYLVSEGEVLDIEKLAGKKLEFEPLLLINDDKVSVGTPSVTDIKVYADVVAEDKLGDKTVSIRYKAKKRVHTVKGHRQHLTTIKITKIA